MGVRCAQRLQEAKEEHDREMAKLRRRLEDDGQLNAARSGMDAAQQDIQRARAAIETAMAARSALTSTLSMQS